MRHHRHEKLPIKEAKSLQVSMVRSHSRQQRRLGSTCALLAHLVCAATPASETPPETGLMNASGWTFSPDAKVAYFAAWNGTWGSSNSSKSSIYVAHSTAQGWSRPVVVSFDSSYSDSDPFVAPDGRWLYFVSDRPTGQNDDDLDSNIWRYSLHAPSALEPLSVNSSATEYSPIVSELGNLYFASDRIGGAGQGDLYMAEAVNGEFGSPRPLGPAFNSSTGEWNLWVSAKEDEILFEASSRVTNVSTSGDIYYSWYSDAGWVPAISVVELNSDGSDLLPRLHPSGLEIFYTNARIGGHATISSAQWAPIRSRLREQFAPRLMVVNRSSHDVSIVDLTAGKETERIATGDGPHLLSNVENGLVAVTGFGVYPKPHEEPIGKRPPFIEALNSRLTVFDTTSGAVQLEFTMEDCARPHSSWIKDSRVFVTCEPQEQVVIFDLKLGQVVKRISTDQSGAHVLSVDPRTHTIAVSNTQSGSVALIDSRDWSKKIVDLAPGTEGLALVRGDFWAGNAFDGSISVVDPAIGEEVARIEDVCSFPIALDGTANDLAWVACFGSSELVSIDTDTLYVKRRISLSHQPLHLLRHPTRPFIYVSYPRQNAIAEIDTQSGAEIRRIPVGIEPDGLRWANPATKAAAQ